MSMESLGEIRLLGFSQRGDVQNGFAYVWLNFATTLRTSVIATAIPKVYPVRPALVVFVKIQNPFRKFYGHGPLPS